MVTARIRTPGVIGKVEVQQNLRTIVADPKFKPKPNVALTELIDTSITTLEDGQVVTYSAEEGKFVAKGLGDIDTKIDRINGGFF
jgi:vacuolar-type H+-ATPase subunit E/Vma4